MRMAVSKVQGRVAVVVALVATFLVAPAIAADPLPCDDLAAVVAGSAGVKDVNSVIVDASGSTPAYCQVDILYGTNDDQNINVRVGLPLNSADEGECPEGSNCVQGAWNGRTEGIGGGGCSGSTRVTSPVSAGFVGAGSDAGHSGGSCTPGVNEDGTYNYQFINDFIRNGMKAEVLFMKSVAESYYGMKPAYNYWNGCSTGGRQGYVIAQELPTGLDGILANAPAMYWTRFQTAQMWGQVVMHDLVGGVINRDKMNLATAAAVAACDADDGMADGVIDDPRTCTYSAAALITDTCTVDDMDCLTPEEAQAIDMIWDGPRNADGDKIWFGLERGSSITSLNGTNPFSLGTTQLQWDTHDRNFDWTAMSIDDYAQVAEEGSRNIADVTDTFGDLDEFRRHGGKLLTYVGAYDNLIMPRGVINYYRQMAARYDYRQDHASAGTGPAKGHGNEVDFTGVQQFYRLFRAIGAGHCGAGGSGPFDALMDWVENGNAPEHIDVTVGFGPSAANRRMCPYPQTAIYDEACGDSNNPDCYSCGGNLETPSTVCNDVLVKYKHEAGGPLDYTGTGVNQHECSDAGN